MLRNNMTTDLFKFFYSTVDYEKADIKVLQKVLAKNLRRWPGTVA